MGALSAQAGSELRRARVYDPAESDGVSSDVPDFTGLILTRSPFAGCARGGSIFA